MTYKKYRKYFLSKRLLVYNIDGKCGFITVIHIIPYIPAEYWYNTFIVYAIPVDFPSHGTRNNIETRQQIRYNRTLKYVLLLCDIFKNNNGSVVYYELSDLAIELSDCVTSHSYTGFRSIHQRAPTSTNNSQSELTSNYTMFSPSTPIYLNRTRRFTSESNVSDHPPNVGDVEDLRSNIASPRFVPELIGRETSPNDNQHDSISVVPIAEPINVTQERPVYVTQERPINVTQERLITVTQERSINVTQERPINVTQERPLNVTQERLINVTQEGNMPEHLHGTQSRNIVSTGQPCQQSLPSEHQRFGDDIVYKHLFNRLNHSTNTNTSHFSVEPRNNFISSHQDEVTSTIDFNYEEKLSNDIISCHADKQLNDNISNNSDKRMNSHPNEPLKYRSSHYLDETLFHNIQNPQNNISCFDTTADELDGAAAAAVVHTYDIERSRNHTLVIPVSPHTVRNRNSLNTNELAQLDVESSIRRPININATPEPQDAFLNITDTCRPSEDTNSDSYYEQMVLRLLKRGHSRERVVRTIRRIRQQSGKQFVLEELEALLFQLSENDEDGNEES